MNVKHLDDEVSSPLFHAVIHRQENVVDLLLAQKACVNNRDRAGNNPLHLAAGSGQWKTTSLLLSRGDIDYNARNNIGETALSLVASKIRIGKLHGEFLMVLEILVSNKNVDLNVGNKKGVTPIQLLAEYGILGMCITQ